MAIVQLVIGGQKYTVSCGDGQEGVLQRAAALLDEKVTQVRRAGHIPETLGLVMGGLLLASELDEKRIQLQKQASQSFEISHEDLLKAAENVEKAAERISVVAERLENA